MKKINNNCGGDRQLVYLSRSAGLAAVLNATWVAEHYRGAAGIQFDQVLMWQQPNDCTRY